MKKIISSSLLALATLPFSSFAMTHPPVGSIKAELFVEAKLVCKNKKISSLELSSPVNMMAKIKVSHLQIKSQTLQLINLNSVSSFYKISRSYSYGIDKKSLIFWANNGFTSDTTNLGAIDKSALETRCKSEGNLEKSFLFPLKEVEKYRISLGRVVQNCRYNFNDSQNAAHREVHYEISFTHGPAIDLFSDVIEKYKGYSDCTENLDDWIDSGLDAGGVGPIQGPWV